MVRYKKPMCFNFSPKSVELVTQLSRDLGINKTAVVEMAVHKLARKELQAAAHRELAKK